MPKNLKDRTYYTNEANILAVFPQIPVVTVKEEEHTGKQGTFLQELIDQNLIDREQILARYGVRVITSTHGQGVQTSANGEVISINDPYPEIKYIDYPYAIDSADTELRDSIYYTIPDLAFKMLAQDQHVKFILKSGSVPMQLSNFYSLPLINLEWVDGKIILRGNNSNPSLYAYVAKNEEAKKLIENKDKVVADQAKKSVEGFLLAWSKARKNNGSLGFAVDLINSYLGETTTARCQLNRVCKKLMPK